MARLAGPVPRLTARGFAHRGLHGNGVPENSRAAILAAVTAGWGVEIDAVVALRPA